MIKIGLAQINPTLGDFKKNMALINSLARSARKQKVDLLVFPELALIGYPPEDLLMKPQFIQTAMECLNAIKACFQGIQVIIGTIDVDGKGQIYNAAAFISDQDIVGIYHKHELPNYGVFDECRYFQPGQTDGVFTLASGEKFGVTICEDIWCDQGVFEKQVAKGIEFMINISASPYDVEKHQRREQLLRDKVLDHRVPIFYSNLVGGQDELVFDGRSLVLDQTGAIVAEGKSFQEDLLTVSFPLEESVVQSAVNESVEDIYQALVLGTRDYITKNGFKKVLLGISGGIDSALVAAIAVDAIGKDQVVGVSMPSRFSSTGTKSDARLLAKNLGITFKEISIESLYKEYLAVLNEEFAGTPSGVAEENIQARIRGQLLMALSNKFGWLVLTTGNKSEMAVGYCTLYGDMSGGWAVLKDVPKTWVYQLSGHKNAMRGHDVIPIGIIDRPPSAELRDNQTDQDSLPAYDILDQILKDYVECHMPYATLIQKYDAAMVQKIIQLVDQNEYKRRQSPPGVKITPRAFGRDWRLPLTNQFKPFSQI